MKAGDNDAFMKNRSSICEKPVLVLQNENKIKFILSTLLKKYFFWLNKNNNDRNDVLTFVFKILFTVLYVNKEK